MKSKFKFLVAFLLVFAFMGCAKSTGGVKGNFDDIFKDDNKFVPINSAEIQRQIEKDKGKI